MEVKLFSMCLVYTYFILRISLNNCSISRLGEHSKNDVSRLLLQDATNYLRSQFSIPQHVIPLYSEVTKQHVFPSFSEVTKQHAFPSFSEVNVFNRFVPSHLEHDLASPLLCFFPIFWLSKKWSWTGMDCWTLCTHICSMVTFSQVSEPVLGLKLLWFSLFFSFHQIKKLFLH